MVDLFYRNFAINKQLMNTPDFIASATAFASGSNGDVFRSAVATSSKSQADAEQKAKILAQQYANDVAHNPRQHMQERERYPYGVRNLIEPIQERVRLGADELALITTNNYGASVLNAHRVMFVDVDTENDAGRDPRTGMVIDGQSISNDEALNALADLVAARDDLMFRVYSTAAGLRYICTSRFFDPESTESDEILKYLKSDKRYVLLCKKQKCYRARLSPKPWRCNKVVTLADTDAQLQNNEPRGFFAKLFSSAKPRTKTLTKVEDFAVCRFIETVGTNSVTMPPEIAAIVRLHDNACGVTTTKPLA